MPKIPTEVLRSTFYLYASADDARAGRNNGGTGFLVLRRLPGSEVFSQTYAVTNWHVAVAQGFSVIRLNRLDGGTEIFEFEPHEWTFRAGGADVAVVPLTIDQSVVEAMPLDIGMLVSKESVAERGIGPGEDTFMVGRFMDHDGGVRNEPAVRFGHISLMPVPIRQENGATNESFCIDIHSRTGFSGSPVFVFRTSAHDLTGSVSVIGGRYLGLLGIHWGQFPERWEIKEGDPIPDPDAQISVPRAGQYVQGMSGMTCVAPAWDINDIITTGALGAEFDRITATFAEAVLADGPGKLSGFEFGNAPTILRGGTFPLKK